MLTDSCNASCSTLASYSQFCSILVIFKISFNLHDQLRRLSALKKLVPHKQFRRETDVVVVGILHVFYIETLHKYFHYYMPTLVIRNITDNIMVIL